MDDAQSAELKNEKKKQEEELAAMNKEFQTRKQQLKKEHESQV